MENTDTKTSSHNSPKRSRMDPPNKETEIRPHPAVYASYCTPRDDAFVMCACALGYQLKRENISYPRLLMLPYECFDRDGQILDHFRMFYEFWDILHPIRHPHQFPFFYAKMNAFSLTKYERVLFMEPYCITNCNRLETFFNAVQHVPSAPDNHRYGRYYEAMAVRPDMSVFMQMAAASYRTGPHLQLHDVHKVIDISCRWATLMPANMDRPEMEWLFTVRHREVARGDGDKECIIAFFQDSNPWELSKILKRTGTKCEAVSVWMDTARRLVEESQLIHTLVNPKILNMIKTSQPKRREYRKKTVESVVDIVENTVESTMGNTDTLDEDKDGKMEAVSPVMETEKGGQSTQNGDAEEENPYLDPLLVHKMKEFEPQKNDEFVDRHRKKYEPVPPAPPSISNSSVDEEVSEVEDPVEIEQVLEPLVAPEMSPDFESSSDSVDMNPRDVDDDLDVRNQMKVKKVFRSDTEGKEWKSVCKKGTLKIYGGKGLKRVLVEDDKERIDHVVPRGKGAGFKKNEMRLSCQWTARKDAVLKGDATVIAYFDDRSDFDRFVILFGDAMAMDK